MGNIVGQILLGWDVREAARDAVLDGCLDPEFILHCNEALDRDDPEQLAYLRLINSVDIAFRTFGDEYLRTLGLDPRDVVW